MSSKKKKSDGRSGELEKAEEVFQAVILTDSFNFRFLPITLETPRVSELQITCSSQLIFCVCFFFVSKLSFLFPLRAPCHEDVR